MTYCTLKVRKIRGEFFDDTELELILWCDNEMFVNHLHRVLNPTSRYDNEIRIRSYAIFDDLTGLIEGIIYDPHIDLLEVEF